MACDELKWKLRRGPKIRVIYDMAHIRWVELPGNLSAFILGGGEFKGELGLVIWIFSWGNCFKGFTPFVGGLL